MDLFLSFNGRINRAKWWLGSIVVFVALVVLYMILMFVVGGGMTVNPDGTVSGGGTITILSIVLYLAALWPSLALQIKRWHDRDKSGWWVLINFVPIIGGLWALIECGFLEGTKGPNKFGPDPLAQAAVA